MILGILAGAWAVGCATSPPGDSNNNGVIPCEGVEDCPVGYSCEGNVCVPPSDDDGGVPDAQVQPGAISVFPNPVQFGHAPLHLDTVQDVTIANSGAGSLTVSALVLEENDGLAEFRLQLADATPLVIAPNGQYTLQVVLHPDDGELDFGQLHVYSDDPDQGVTTVELESAYKGDPTLQVCVMDESVTNPEPFVHCVLDPGTSEPVINYGEVSIGVAESQVVAIRNGADGNFPLTVTGAHVETGNPAVIPPQFAVRLYALDTDGVTQIDLTPPVYLGAGVPSESIPPEVIYAEVTFDADTGGTVSDTRLIVQTNDPTASFVPITALVTDCEPGFVDLNGDPSDGCEYACSYTGQEICGSGFDENCNGVQDEPGAGGCTVYYLDTDGDTYGVTADSQCLCAPDAANDYDATQGGDCNDSNNLINPAGVEVCDGNDNNCNGQIDENLGTTTCGLGNCTHTVNNCVGGVPQSCDPFQGASTETCDGQDNDCDGQVDEELGSTTCGVGACLHTVDNCAGGVPQFCNPFQGASAEVCDGVDNDCNGQTDENLGSSTCGLGECQHSEPNCVGGVPNTCDPMLGATTEACDGLDNDCDGQVDENLGSSTCGVGECLHSEPNCVGGVPNSCDPMQGQSTEVCDGLDNDCDGNVDEMTQTDVNNCGSCGNQCTNAHGTTLCSGGTCVPTCVGLYDSCDGDPDNGCETALTTLSNCGSCGGGCSLANASETCSTGSCQVSSCTNGYCNQDGAHWNGCEYDLDTEPTCSTFQDLGGIAGDTGSQTVTVTGVGERWYRIHVNETETGLTTCKDLCIRVNLTVPTGTDYDVYGYCDNCTGADASSTLTGSSNEVMYMRWEEGCIWPGIPSGSDSDRDIWIRVAYWSANVCSNYTLSITGNACSGGNTCSQK